MFSVKTNDGQPLTAELATLRASLEPLVEASQIKGDGESHPFLSPNDEFADYELWDDANLDGTQVKKPEMLQYEYVRSALNIGLTLEKVHDVVWSDDRGPGPDGKLPAVGNTVDVRNATWTNTIGSPELIAVWTDPAFDPKQSAFYYVRVIEIPMPRWTAYETHRFGVEMPNHVPMITQERAYTSPIWYTP